jgi:predicted nucleic acid-binding protein
MLAEVGRRPNDYVIDAEVLQEVLHVYAARHTPEKGAAAIERMLVLFPWPIPIGAAEIRRAGRLLVEHPRLSARDAIHAAVVMVRGLEAIITTDRDFDGVSGLRRLSPEAALG